MPNLAANFCKLLLLFVFGLMLFGLSSCGAWNTPSLERIKVITTEPATVTLNNEQKNTKRNKAKFKANYFPKGLELKVKVDSIEKHMTVAKVVSVWDEVDRFMSFNYTKRYSYPGRIFVDLADTQNRYSTISLPPKKGDFKLNISLPYFNTNAFYFNPPGETTKSKAGFIGIIGGLEYYHTNKQFLNVTAGSVTNYAIPVAVPIHTEGESERLYSVYVAVSNNHVLNRFSVGYGLSYSLNVWDYINTRGLAYFNERYLQSTEGRIPTRIDYNTFGFVFNTYYKLSNEFNVGIIYRPTFYRPGIADKFRYEHVISIDFAWKIKLLNFAKQKAK